MLEEKNYEDCSEDFKTYMEQQSKDYWVSAFAMEVCKNDPTKEEQTAAIAHDFIKWCKANLFFSLEKSREFKPDRSWVTCLMFVEPWALSKDQYLSIVFQDGDPIDEKSKRYKMGILTHKDEIKKAVKNGFQVPYQVLKSYAGWNFADKLISRMDLYAAYYPGKKYPG